jgi:transposase
MPKGNTLTDYEKGQIDILHKDGKSQREIAKAIGRKSQKIIYTYLHSSDNTTKVQTGRKRKLSEAEERLVIRHASNKRISLNKLAEECDLQVSKQTISRVLERCEYIKYTKMKKKTPLSRKNVKGRVDFGHDHMTWDEKWREVIFSDEKRFNLDGPDGFNYYWHDLRKEEVIYSRRQQGGGGVMVWAAFGALGKSDIIFYDGTMKSENYQEMLYNKMLPFARRLWDKDRIFQQDNAPIHVSESTMKWFEENGVTLLPFPPNSPDLNPMENLWGLLVRRVYAIKRNFNDKTELKEAIKACWGTISVKELRPLIDSMKERIYQLIKSGGRSTKF